ncbi:biopolymer transporter ExbD [Stappia sp. 28M-7]|uniref:biopolymer transporter ExbD n=1 Tax=Stappia sp. 28M-7 TaxID=2762596 RepID=UPI00163C06B6|nr:biopolymer transporter ExbD [Stappia sp. 28M-7]MBC2859223.1 biopolymer transporter ExbD [Stappia sp. 28M-7]
MRIDFASPRRRRLSLTSLIDVIFLLLLFFMLSSTFTRFAQVDLAAPGGGTGGAVTRPDIFATVDANGLTVNGTLIDPEAPGTAVSALVEAGAKTALLVPREGARAQDLVSALELLRGGGELKVIVARPK